MSMYIILDPFKGEPLIHYHQIKIKAPENKPYKAEKAIMEPALCEGIQSPKTRIVQMAAAGTKHFKL